jgi:hypothetical protein
MLNHHCTSLLRHQLGRHEVAPQRHRFHQQIGTRFMLALTMWSELIICLSSIIISHARIKRQINGPTSMTMSNAILADNFTLCRRYCLQHCCHRLFRHHCLLSLLSLQVATASLVRQLPSYRHHCHKYYRGQLAETVVVKIMKIVDCHV